MKKMVLQKQEAKPLVEFLQGLVLKNKISRLRNKLIKNLSTITQELEEERVELVKEHSEKDEQGEPIIENEQYKVFDMEALNEQVQELFAEEVAIETGEYSSNFQPLFEHLDSEDFDMELSGIEANRYDRLLDIWENAQTQTEEEL
ncbi:DUF1617 family protein [Jeotgalibaca sp. MA1X17-3]|uniref:DUF1617 family protein n=1 Tax=Jeotgalibaca sp. MA1X17-3 TaxID=2908211 RepID=UPI001F26106E|nr:DUF1617 family protein [Jeotgalibaca sp. MA1X17-3]UJF15055.1 DUF1617 family protein [Jeotgalibaca sp. MA1X17-3]